MGVVGSGLPRQTELAGQSSTVMMISCKEDQGLKKPQVEIATRHPSCAGKNFSLGRGLAYVAHCSEPAASSSTFGSYGLGMLRVREQEFLKDFLKLSTQEAWIPDGNVSTWSSTACPNPKAEYSSLKDWLWF